MKLKVALIDDEPDALTVLSKYIELYFDNCIIVGTANNVKSAVKLIKATQPDVLLLDIQLDDGTGFDILDHFEKRNFKIIFITAYDHYAVKAFKYHALNYLLKPISPKELSQAFEQLDSLLIDNHALQVKNLQKFDPIKLLDKISISTIQGFTLVRLSDIIRIESDGNYTSLYLKDKSKLFTTKTMTLLEELLDPYLFFRTHQSHIINLSYVQTYNKENGSVIFMENGDQIPLSRRKKELFIEMFMK